MNVFITRKIPQEGVELLQINGFTVKVNEDDKALSQQEIIDACQDAEYLIVVAHTTLDAHFFEACPKLKGIALASVGYDHVDMDAATKHGVPVSNTPDVLSGATADVAFLLMLAVSRKAFARSKQIDQGKWKDLAFTQDLGIELNRKTLGILGLGRIGAEMAKKAQGAYDMSIIYHNRNRNEEAEKQFNATYVSFEELLQQSDVISVHTNLSPQTQYIFNKEAFEKMKDSAIFINTARGKIHHEQDLTDALATGTIWGAGLDVTDPEPMQADNPLLQMPNVCVLPHIGSATIETRTAMARMAARNLIATSQGRKMPQVVNTDVYPD